MTDEPIFCAELDRHGLRAWWQCPVCGACYPAREPFNLDNRRLAAKWCCQVPTGHAWLARLIADAEAA